MAHLASSHSRKVLDVSQREREAHIKHRRQAGELKTGLDVVKWLCWVIETGHRRSLPKLSSSYSPHLQLGHKWMVSGLVLQNRNRRGWVMHDRLRSAPGLLKKSRSDTDSVQMKRHQLVEGLFDQCFCSGLRITDEVISFCARTFCIESRSFVP
jgi:hypothetical protein